MKILLLIQLCVVAAIAIFSIGCRKNPPAPGQSAPLSASEVNSNLMEVFSAIGNTADSSYVLPAKPWIDHEFRSAWLTFKSSLGTWEDNENDCDDFARGAAFFAQLLHHNTPSHQKRTALAFGEFWYQRRQGDGHAINFYLYHESGRVQIGFFEPQTGDPIAMTQKEIESCVTWRL